jgi:hypothetical protein
MNMKNFLSTMRDRIAAASSESELQRTERALAAIHQANVGLLSMLAPDIAARRRALRRAVPEDT